MKVVLPTVVASLLVGCTGTRVKRSRRIQRASRQVRCSAWFLTLTDTLMRTPVIEELLQRRRRKHSLHQKLRARKDKPRALEVITLRDLYALSRCGAVPGLERFRF